MICMLLRRNMMEDCMVTSIKANVVKEDHTKAMFVRFFHLR